MILFSYELEEIGKTLIEALQQTDEVSIDAVKSHLDKEAGRLVFHVGQVPPRTQGSAGHISWYNDARLDMRTLRLAR